MNTCKAGTFDLSKVKVEYGLSIAKACTIMVDGMPCDECIEGELSVRRDAAHPGDSRFANIGRSCHDCGGTRSECDCSERCIRGGYAYDERIKREREEARTAS